MSLAGYVLSYLRCRQSRSFSQPCVCILQMLLHMFPGVFRSIWNSEAWQSHAHLLLSYMILPKGVILWKCEHNLTKLHQQMYSDWNSFLKPKGIHSPDVHLTPIMITGSITWFTTCFSLGWPMSAEGRTISKKLNSICDSIMENNFLV